MFTCIRCLADTENDNDICDTCADEATREAEGTPPPAQRLISAAHEMREGVETERAMPVSKEYVLLHNGKQIGKAHSTIEAVTTEAFEHGLVVSVKGNKCFADGVEIRELDENIPAPEDPRVVELRESNSLLAAMLIEKRPDDEIEEQIKRNNEAIEPGFHERRGFTPPRTVPSRLNLDPETIRAEAFRKAAQVIATIFIQAQDTEWDEGVNYGRRRYIDAMERLEADARSKQRPVTDQSMPAPAAHTIRELMDEPLESPTGYCRPGGPKTEAERRATILSYVEALEADNAKLRAEADFLLHVQSVYRAERAAVTEQSPKPVPPTREVLAAYERCAKIADVSINGASVAKDIRVLARNLCCPNGSCWAEGHSPKMDCLATMEWSK